MHAQPPAFVHSEVTEDPFFSGANLVVYRARRSARETRIAWRILTTSPQQVFEWPI